MKLNTSLCLGTLAVTLAAPLWADDELAPPIPPPAPAEQPAPAPRHRSGRKGEFSENVDTIAAQARTLGGKFAAEAKLAAEHARLAAMDIRQGFRRGDGNRTLVLPSGNAAPESLAESHEDLSVMSRILNKAVAKESRRGGLRGFSFSMGETGGNLDAMYLEGYGAVFLLNADFPLVSPPTPTAAKAASKEEDATWERAKREVRGNEVPDDDVFGTSGGVWNSDEDQPKYDAEKVDALKRRLLDTFKHGKNLRALKESEHLTVIVFGKTLGKRTRTGRVQISDELETKLDEAAPGTVVSQNIFGYVNTDSVRQSTLVLRAKKSDLTRFASGAMTAEEFNRLVSVSAF